MWPFTRKADPSADKPKIPEHFERYSELAKWLIAIISGVLAFGMQAVKGAGAGWALGLFIGCGVVLTATIGAALLFFLSFNYYRALRENGEPEKAPDVADSRWWAERYFRVMLGGFALGMAMFLVFAVTLLVSTATPEPGSTQITALPPGAPGFAIVEQGGKFWLLRRDAKGRLIWRPLRAPPG